MGKVQMDYTIVKNDQNKEYQWSQDHVRVKMPVEKVGEGLTIVEDTLNPGFLLSRHYHKQMTETFIVLDGAVEFVFDDRVIRAQVGDTIRIPPLVRHEVKSESGAKMLTIFNPGGFEKYFQKLRKLDPAQLKDAMYMQQLSEEFDSWEESITQ